VINADVNSSEEIALKGVSFAYNAHPVLQDVSFAAKRGEFLVIIGPNGCGKSTALRLLSGLLSPKTGQVVLEGVTVAKMGRRALARRLALLAQSNSVPEGMTVEDLVGMGRYAHETWLRRKTPKDREKIASAMELMEITELSARRLGELSGGQLQRVRMAMTLAQDTPFILLDEPTNHLDPRHQHDLLHLARRAATENKSVIAVLHDLTQASLYADRIVMMSDGHIIADGPPQNVMTPELIKQVYGLRTVAVPIGRTVIHLPESAVS
tara:strand:+ start:79999 stop:80799 length:801 start_codon:yes stop_codon:yes gene_type:complete